jgi:hypothetical protein
MRGSGNHESHCTISPGRYMMRSAGSSPAYSGRIWRIRSFNVVIEYSHPILSAMTVAGIRGKSASNFRTSVSTASTNEPRLPLVLRRPVRRQRRPHGVARDAQPPHDLFDRDLL